MMTSTPSTPQQQTDGRTVREIVDNNQELVNESWCRRIFRQVLQSLELQYAMQMPHRPITPDTLLVLDSGDPMLLPTPGTEPGDHEASDLHDLAAVVHYAITREPAPHTPLRGRLSDEYSESFVNAIDACLSPDPAQRPQTIEQLRNLLGIVVLGPAIPGQAPGAPAFAAPGAYPAAAEPEPSFLTSHARAPGGMQRWMMMLAAATVLLGGLAALLALLHQADSRDTLTLALPTDERPSVPEAPAAQAMSAALPQAGVPAGPGAVPPGAPVAMPPPVPLPATPPARSTPPAPPSSVTILPVGSQAGATYKLLIKPWGRILVNGVERGVSPPLKRLTLPSGQHTIRIINPSFPEHTVTVQSVKGETAVIELDFTEEETQ